MSVQWDISQYKSSFLSCTYRRIEARQLKRGEHVRDAQETQETLIIVISAQHTLLLLMV